eukprot:6482303-Pyramimonas_sp.AAC.1
MRAPGTQGNYPTMFSEPAPSPKEAEERQTSLFVGQTTFQDLCCHQYLKRVAVESDCRGSA